MQRSIKSNIHILQFSIVHSYFYRLGETGCCNSLPLKGTSSSMFLSFNMNCMYRSKQNQICLSHGILHFPCSRIWAKMSPLHLYLCNGSVPERGFLSVQYALGFWYKFSLQFHLDHRPVNYMISIMYIFLQ